jgi:acetolactate synthase-1/2/3 large subunit
MSFSSTAATGTSTQSATVTVAQIVAATLRKAGVTYVFGLPGGETVELLDALRLAGIEFVLVHNESSALFMADTYARVTGSVGVCLTTLGPGATNACVGLAHAYLDRSPVILITAQKPDTLLPDYTHQVLDLHSLFRPITKASVKVNAANAATAIRDALALTRQGRPGPVHLQLSNEDAALPAIDATPQLPNSQQPAQHSHSAIAQAVETFRRARRPLILAGLGLEPQRPYALLRELAEQSHAPVIVTPKGKGALPDDHPLAAGVVGLMRNDPAYAIVDEADCILAVGFDVVELVRPWKSDAELIWLAPWENVDPVVPHTVSLVGDMRPALEQLIDAAYSPDEAWGEARVARFRQSQAKTLPAPAANRLLPQQLLESMRTLLPAATPLAVDVGSHKILSSLEWPTLAPNSFFLSNGLSSMGFALPAAIGAALAAPGQPSVCLTGDAGMSMVMGELGLVAHHNLPLLVIVCNDGAIDLIRSQQVRAGKPVYGTEFDSPNFSQIAAAYGLANARVTTRLALDDEIATFVNSPGPRVVEVMLDPISYPTTPSP